MLVVSDIRKEFNSTIAVERVSFTAVPGQAVGLLGRNGAGKTTTLRMLAAIYQPSAGTITLDGNALYNTQATRTSFGFMPDTPPLYLDMRVREYLQHLATLRGVHKPARKLAVDSVIERCNLQSVSKKLLCHLSRGYAQRVSLAQALIHDPQVLILDEPTTGLDPEQVLEIRSLLTNLAAHKILIFSSHVLSEVQAVCAKVVILSAGRSVFELALADLPTSKSLEQYFFDALKLEDSPAQLGVAI